MKKILFVILLLMFANSALFADTVSIDRFTVKENPFALSKPIERAITAPAIPRVISFFIVIQLDFTLLGIVEFIKGTKFQNGTFLWDRSYSNRFMQSYRIIISMFGNRLICLFQVLTRFVFFWR